MNSSGTGWILAALAAYIVGFSLFPPEVLSTADESLYLEQASAFAAGRLVLDDPFENPPGGPVTHYPPGTSLIQAPLVAAGGWRAGAWASVLGLAVTTLMLAQWLRDAGYWPGFAILFLAYPPTLVYGRLATSDLPGAALITTALWLVWMAAGSTRAWLAGVVAGVSTLVRETSVLLFLPFLAAMAAGRTPHWKAASAGLLVGISLRLLAFLLILGTPLFIRPATGWSLYAPLDSLPLYLWALLVMMPGGLLVLVLYCGRNRAALLAAALLFLLVHLFYDYSGQDSAAIARLATGGRYLIPIVPLVALAWADLAARLQWRPRAVMHVAGIIVVFAAFGIHPILAFWNRDDAAIVRDVYANSADGDVLIVDHFQREYVSPVYGRRSRVWMEDESAPARAVAAPDRATYLVLVSRPESAELLASPRNYLARVEHACRLETVHDRQYGAHRRLQMWRIRSCP